MPLSMFKTALVCGAGGFIGSHLGVRGRSSDNKLIKAKLGWEPTAKLEDGLRTTYKWISQQVDVKNE